jgi:phosphatidylglycerol:prolipoprotein diacylglycerol transferase
MFPYIRIGPIVLGAYGITMGLAFVLAWKALEVNLRRHHLTDRLAEPIIFLLALAGILGSKLYSALEAPSQRLAHPLDTLLSSNGYTWFGGFLAAITTLWFLAKHFHIPALRLMDMVSPCAALGYGIGRLGCLFAGDGDYGTATSLPWGMSFPAGLVPTTQFVHPTPIYECLVNLFFFYYLWRVAEKELPDGSVLARYLLLTGSARFLVEFIRLNPRTLLGLSDAQIVSLLCVVAGLLLLGYNSPALRIRRSSKPAVTPAMTGH